jgi:twitching motility protein PilT
VRTADGNGRVATCEILVMTGRTHDAILDPEQTGHMHEVIKEGEYYGMQSFDQHLLKHLQAGRITFDEAMKVASSPHDFKLLVQADQRLRHLASANAEENTVEAPAAEPEPPVVADVAPEAPAPSSEPVMAPPPAAPDAPPAPAADAASAPPPGF